MKKLFHKLETNTNASSIGSQSLNAGSTNNDSNQIKDFIGKSFSVGRYNVVIEDVIAEGRIVVNFESIQFIDQIDHRIKWSR